MAHEISQFDIPDRQMLGGYAQPKASMRSDIGEAKITRTIFGGAKVRVIREQDRILRNWLLALLVLTVLAAAAWQGWSAWQQMLNVAPPLPLSERIRVSAPVYESGDAATTDSISSRNKAKTPTEIILDSMSTRRPPPPLKPIEQISAKPVASQTAIANKLNPATPTGIAAKNQTDLQPRAVSPKTTIRSAIIQQSVPEVATPPAQPEASKAEADVAPAAPAINAGGSLPSISGDNQSAEPDSAQINARGTAIIYVDPPAKTQP